MQKISLSNSFKPWVMWSPPLVFFAYQFILRLWPSLAMQQIMAQYQIDATAFGFLSAVYYLGYAGMQIPVALMLDRYPAHRVIGGFAILSGFSMLLFSSSGHWLIALLGRFMIGFASAAGFLGTSKAVSLWFPESRYGRMIGYTFSFGLLGALYGGRPVNNLIEGFGFAETAQLISVTGIMIGIVILCICRNPEKIPSQNPSTSFCRADLATILANRNLALVAIGNLLMVGALEGFADVWGVSFLVTAHGVSKETAAGMISLIYMGMLAGGPILAFLSERLGGRNVIMLCGAGIAILFSIILFFCNDLSSVSIQLLLFLVGVMCCYQVVVFSISASYVETRLMGVAIAFLNCINMLGGSFFHSIIGYMADLFWEGSMAGGCRVYSTSTYTTALLVIPVCAFAGGLLPLFARTSTHIKKGEKEA